MSMIKTYSYEQYFRWLHLLYGYGKEARVANGKYFTNKNTMFICNPNT